MRSCFHRKLLSKPASQGLVKQGMINLLLTLNINKMETNKTIPNKLLVILLLLLAFFSVEKSIASSAAPYPVRVTQKDKTMITVLLQGDEHLKWAKTMDNYTLVFNSMGIYEYGKIDASGDLVPSGVKAHDVSNRTQRERAFITTIAKNLTYNRSQVNIVQQIIRNSTPTTTTAFPTTGNRKLICVLIGFTDLAFTKTQVEFQNLFNQVGFSADGAAGSVKDFFLENSYNQLNLTVDVAGPYTASNTQAYYGANTAGQATDIRPRELVTEAVNLANADVNFADYDNDGDGNVDGVYIIYAGHGEEVGAGTDAIWAHAWSIPSVTLDGKNISRYSTSSELRDGSGSGLTRIGVICHEFGHVLGAPDYYDTDYGTGGQYNGNGHWDLNASGNYNNDSKSPAHSNPYTKIYIYNWATVTTLSAQGTVTLQKSTLNANNFYRYNTTTANEFFIMENRQQTGFDVGVPGHGLLIYHAHADLGSHLGPNDINATAPQYFYPVCASASTNPGATPASYGSNDGDGTTYPGTSNKTSFTDATTPNAKSWAGVNTAKPIAFITEDNAAKTVTFCFLGCPPVAEFSANNTTPCSGDVVTFSDLSTYSPTSWAWSFSPATVSYTGGTNASSQNPQVIFNAAGAYTVTLTATNAYGSDPEVKTNYINVTAKPTVTLQPTNQVKQWGDNASFTSTAIGTPSPTVQWQLSTDGGGSWADIGGETNTTLNLSCITLAMNGYQYRAVFSNICGSTPSAAATLTVTPRVSTGTVTIAPNPQQYSDPTTLSVVLANAVACGEQAATSVTFFIGTQEMGTVTLTISGTDLIASLPVLLLEPTPFGTSPTGQMAPGVHTVTAVFNGVNPNFTLTPATAPLTITPEDARAYYTGACFVGTQSATSLNAVVTLSATFKDITAVLGDPSYDAYAGDIRNATITFINRDNNTIIAANVPFGLVNPADSKIAVATYNWNVTISGNSQSFTVGIIIGGYYSRNSSTENTVVTVSQPLPNFVAGGGFLILSSSAGIKSGDAGSKNNFGFNAKYNQRGNTLQGNINSIVRKTESDGLHVYQIKGNKLTSLSVQPAAVGGKATINSKASITDITNPLLPISIDANGSMQVKLTDQGEPGSNDSISITIWNRAGGLWYASNWNGTRTVEQVLDGGNLRVNSNSSFVRLLPVDENSTSLPLSVFPNPSDGQFTISFTSEENLSYRIRLMDISGREMYFETFSTVQGDNLKSFDLKSLSNGLYLLLLENDTDNRMIKVIVNN